MQRDRAGLTGGVQRDAIGRRVRRHQIGLVVEERFVSTQAMLPSISSLTRSKFGTTTVGTSAGVW